MKLTQTFAVFAVLVLFAACSSSQPAGDGTASAQPAIESTAPPFDGSHERDEISGREAQRMVAEGAALVDVRIPEEFDEEHVPGAVNIPLAEIHRAALATHGVGAPIVLYCNTGNQSGQALEKLRAEGVEDVYSMGGIDAWPGATISTDDGSSLYPGGLAQRVDETNRSMDDDDSLEPRSDDQGSLDKLGEDSLDKAGNSLDDMGEDSLDKEGSSLDKLGEDSLDKEGNSLDDVGEGSAD